MPWVSLKDPTLVQLDTIMLECMDRATDNCHDCGVSPGEPHIFGCDVARCPICGGQKISCSCQGEICGEEIWTGLWPGAIECYEYGLVCFWEGPPPVRSWGEEDKKLRFSYNDEANIRFAEKKPKRIHSFKDFIVVYKIEPDIIKNLYLKKQEI
jgi:hypothetical protein